MLYPCVNVSCRVPIYSVRIMHYPPRRPGRSGMRLQNVATVNSVTARIVVRPERESLEYYNYRPKRSYLPPSPSL